MAEVTLGNDIISEISSMNGRRGSRPRRAQVGPVCVLEVFGC